MAVQTGLGEPRGPWFVSPELDPDGRGYRDVPGGGPEAGRRSLRHRLLSVAAVVALSTVSGAAAYPAVKNERRADPVGVLTGWGAGRGRG
ncbi:hypothetical protein ACISRB_32175, partial [Micromonospora aurantiaca]